MNFEKPLINPPSKSNQIEHIVNIVVVSLQFLVCVSVSPSDL